MEVHVRVARGRVWLASTRRYEEVLTLVRGPNTFAHVSYGALEAEDVATRKSWALAPFKCHERTGKLKLAADMALVLSLFGILGKRITWLAGTSLMLQSGDVDTIREAKRVVFSAALDDGFGDLEVSIAVEEDNKGIKDEPEGGTGAFTVQWTSSEALEKELKQREQARVEEERQLVDRLDRVEAKAKTATALRQQAVLALSQQRAARVIQQAYRSLRRRRRAERRRVRKEAEAREHERTMQLRAKIVARNQVRKQRLIEQWRRPLTESKEVAVDDKCKETDDLHEWIAAREEMTRRELQAKLAQLEAERDEKLRELDRLEGRSGRQLHSGRYEETEDPWDDALLDVGLIRAVRSLHLRSR